MQLTKKPCIIVGRCGGFILQQAGIPSFNVFLYADKDVRIKRAGELEENRGQNPKKALEKHDSLRETYYRQYTHHELGDYHSYDICLNTGEIGPERCAEIIASIVPVRSHRCSDRCHNCEIGPERCAEIIASIVRM